MRSGTLGRTATISFVLIGSMRTPMWAADDEPLPLAISSVTPSFRTSSLGPEFQVTFVNTGSSPIPAAALAKRVFVEMDGIRYGRGAVLSHVLPAEIAPGAEGHESIIVGQFGARLAAGPNTITILIGGIRSAPVRFFWSPARSPDQGTTTDAPEQDTDQPPVPLHITQPRYPPAAFQKGISGTVGLEILIDKTGHVAKARVVRSIPELDAAALQCVMEWEFRPAQKAGQPVATVASAPITFTITKKK
jgi:TonB family protein